MVQRFDNLRIVVSGIVDPRRNLVGVDDEKASRERVALAHEDMNQYDSSYYEVELVQAVESIISGMGSVGYSTKVG